MRAVCARCGHDKPEPAWPCPACGHRPADEGLMVAWLLSSANLSEDDLNAAAERIGAGHPLRPTAAALARAARALGRAHADDRGLSRGQRLGLLALSLLVTPLPGLTMAWAWWQARPRAAREALGISVPSGAIVLVAFLVRLFVPDIVGGP